MAVAMADATALAAVPLATATSTRSSPTRRKTDPAAVEGPVTAMVADAAVPSLTSASAMARRSPAGNCSKNRAHWRARLDPRPKRVTA